MPLVKRTSWLGTGLATLSLLGGACRSNEPSSSDPGRFAQPALTGLGATDGSAIGAPLASAGAPMRAQPAGGTSGSAPPDQDTERVRRRYLDVERRRPAQPVCAHPFAFVGFDTAQLAQQRALVAEAWRLYPEFVQLSGEAPDSPFEVRLFSASGSAHAGSILVECADSLTCARAGAVLASAAGLGFAHVCAPVPEIRQRTEWSLVAASTVAPRPRAACGRARLCTGLVLGHSWACNLFVAHDLTSCAAANSCTEVARCVEGLGLASAKPGAPARPYPSLEAPWEVDTTSGRGY